MIANQCGQNCAHCVPVEGHGSGAESQNSRQDSAMKCVSCNHGYFLMRIGTSDNFQQDCIKCSLSNCSTCSHGAQVCHQCNQGYFNDSTPMVTQFDRVEKCSSCPENCNVCSDKNSCEICQFGYEFIAGYFTQNS